MEMIPVEYVKASIRHADQIYELVQHTIKSIYPRYYPAEVVAFFCQLHSRENIVRDIESGNVGVLLYNGRIVGTGSCQDNHITRVYVDPDFQGRGFGSFIMQCLEDEIAGEHDRVYLDASLPACHLYEKRGYTTVRHDRWDVENGAVLVYEVMQKRIG